MIVVKGHNILSPLGGTSKDNFDALIHGLSGVKTYVEDIEPLDPYVASRFDRKGVETLFNKTFLDKGDELSFFEKLCILSAHRAIERAGLDYRDDKTVFVLSTTKGDIGGLIYPSAKRITNFFGNKNNPIVVSNACISGVCAQIAGVRQLLAKKYDTAVIIGCDVLSDFIISGFQSFKALSPVRCKPFDADRQGLNLGEAAATIILERKTDADLGVWTYLSSAINNDATHISAPSRTADGSTRVLQTITAETGYDEIAFVNLHGTATRYNDDMESVAITRAGLSKAPVVGFKGAYGHTLGAAGIVETVLCFEAAERGMIPGTIGFENPGTVEPLNCFKDVTPSHTTRFIKLLSGFGGTNAGIAYGKAGECGETLGHPTIGIVGQAEVCSEKAQIPDYKVIGTIKITPENVVLNNRILEENGEFVALYRKFVGDYPKFFKMDGMSRLGFLAAEILLKDFKDCQPEVLSDLAVILFNSEASLRTDLNYMKTIGKDDYYPSPALFVYTLPNIVCGEIAIRHGLKNETMFFILPENDEETINETSSQSFLTAKHNHILTGWVEYRNEHDYIADLRILKKI